ncbi:MAG: DUF952 domain-containing protein [Promicromonosporaceae bacterium]|nr:DUF952 domain-containing protein [Promicromonosporaceae bacterium]
MIFHLALGADWRAALAGGTGQYRVSARGRPLDEGGFIPCSTAEQVPRLAGRRYRGLDDVLLLRIDPTLVPSEVRYESLDGAAELFPHLYGPLPVDAVVGVAPYREAGEGFPPIDDLFLATAFGAVHEGPTPTLVEVAATVLRDEEGRILTVRKRSTARFMFPGGKPDLDETFQQAAIREAREEVGADLAPADLDFVGIFTAPAANEPELLCREYLYEVREPFPEPRIAAEIEAYRWLDPTRPLPADIAPLVRLIVPQVG